MISYIVIVLILFGIGLSVFNHTLKKLTSLDRIVLSIIVGFVVWSILIYLTSWMQIRFLSPFIAAGICIFGLVKYWNLIELKFPVSRYWLLILLVIAGSTMQLFLVAPSGWQTSNGMAFYGVNAHDGIWHVALMRSLQNQFPPQLPTFAGLSLKGYHYIVDLFGSELVRIFRISPFDLTFRFFPLLFSLLTSLSIYSFVKKLANSNMSAYMAVFLTTVCGSFAYLIPYFTKTAAANESVFWAQQSASTFLNLPLGTSFALIMAVLLLFIYWLESKSRNTTIIVIAAVLSGVTVAVKAYGGMLLVLGFIGILSLHTIYFRKWSNLIPIFVSILVSLLFIIPNLNSKQGMFILEPGWFFKTMMEAPDRINYPKWELLRQTYLIEHNLPRLIYLWTIAIGVFIVGNMGVRIVGFITWMYKLSTPKGEKLYLTYIYLSIMGVLGFLFTSVFIQSGIVWNTIQFFYYSIFLMNIFAGLSLTYIRTRWAKWLVAATIVALAVPTTILTIRNYSDMYSKKAGDYIVNQNEIEALLELQKLPSDSTIISPYSENSYITAFSGKSVYFADKTQADILLLPYKTEVENLNNLFSPRMSDSQLNTFMRDKKLTHVYLPTKNNEQLINQYQTYSSLEITYANPDAIIYKLR